MTLGKIANAMQILEQIKRKKPSFKIDYWVMRNIKIFSDSYNFFVQKRTEILEKYCNLIKDENGTPSYFSLKDGNIIFNLKSNTNYEDFSKEIDELINMSCDETLIPYKLPIDAINNSDFTLDNEEDIFNIDFLLSE